MTRAVLVALALLLALPATGRAESVRLRGLDSVSATLLGDAGRQLSGDRVVVAAGPAVYGWDVARGGKPRRLAGLPKLGPLNSDGVFTDGFTEVAALDATRVVVVRSGGNGAGAGFEPRVGRQLVVGPPDGPFASPAGCGESSGGPAALDGDRLAYVAAPAPKGARNVLACEDGAVPAVDRTSVVVRDLAAPGSPVLAVVPLARADRRVTRLQLAGPFLGVASEVEAFELEERVTVADLRDGRTRLRLPAVEFRSWSLGPDGTVAAAAPVPGIGRAACGPLDLWRGTSPTAERLPDRACAFSLFRLRDGVLRFSRRRDHRFETVDLDLAAGTRRVLARSSGTPVDGDDRRLVVGDDTCSTTAAVRAVALGPVPAAPAGPRRCPIRVRPGRAGTARLPVRVTCPRGCVATFRLGRRTDDLGRTMETKPLRPGSRTVRLRLPDGPESRGGRVPLRVSVTNPGAPTTRLRRVVTLP